MADRGLRVISHTGGTGGFTSEIAFLPEADLGIVILSNSLSLTPIALAFEFAVELRLFEILFDQPAEFDAQLTAQAKTLAATRPPSTLGKVDLTVIAPIWAGTTTPNSARCRCPCGVIGLCSTRASSTELRPLADAEAKTVYLLHDPPLSLFSETYGATVSFIGGAEEPQMTITVPASVTGPEQEFVFKPHR